MKEDIYARGNDIRTLIGTWNIGQGRASHDSLVSWLGSVASDVGVIAVGLQEVEMGIGFLAISTAKETVGLEGCSIGQWWIFILFIDDETNWSLVIFAAWLHLVLDWILSSYWVGFLIKEIASWRTSVQSRKMLLN